MPQTDPNRQVLELLDTLYDGVASADKWPEALHHLAATLGGQGIAVITHHRPTNDLLIDDVGTLQPGIVQGFQAMSDIDPARAAVPLMESGRIYVDHDFHDAARLRRMPFYRDFLHAHGIGHYALLPAGDDAEHIHVLSVQRELGRDTFTENEQGLMRVVQPHLRHAIALRRQLRQQRQETLLLQGALDALTFPLLACSAQGRVATANAAGRHWLAQPHCPLAQPAYMPVPLRRMLAQACGLDGHPPAAGSWQRPHGEWLMALPFVQAALAGGHALALVAIQGPRWRQAPPGALLRALFGLTPAEIRLVHHLIHHDESLTAAAEPLQLSLNTLRTQLKSVFHKTHTRRQSDLMRLMGHLGLLHARDTS